MIGLRRFATLLASDLSLEFLVDLDDVLGLIEPSRDIAAKHSEKPSTRTSGPVRDGGDGPPAVYSRPQLGQPSGISQDQY